MKKMLCPYCDHEMTKKGSCDFCGSRVKKPVYVETTAEFDAPPSAQPNECDCKLHSEDGHGHDDTYRDSEDVSFRQDYEASYGPDVQQTPPPAPAGNGQPRRRAMLASEAVQEVSRQGGSASGGMTKTRRIVLSVLFGWLALQFIFGILSLLL